jgi:hypothetical protein
VIDRPVVWIIDAEQWPRALLRAELIEAGYEAIGFVRLALAQWRAGAGAAALPAAARDRDRPRRSGRHRPSLARLASSGAMLIAVGVDWLNNRWRFDDGSPPPPVT